MTPLLGLLNKKKIKKKKQKRWMTIAVGHLKKYTNRIATYQELRYS